MNRIKAFASVGTLALLLSACSSDALDEGSSERIGVFLDSSAVEGLEYQTETKSGVTNAAGEFEFVSGESVTFSLGNQSLPETQAFDSVTPLTVFGTSDITDQRVVNLSRSLQSLDLDNDASNGITLPDSGLLGNVTSVTSLDFASADFDRQLATVIASLNGDTSIEEVEENLVDVNTANANLMQSLIDEEIIGEGCTSNHPSVGSTGEFQDRSFHGVSGTLTVLDDCTVEVTNFNFDGGGINVRFYAAQDGDFRNFTAVLGPQLLGTRRTNDTIRLELPEGITLDDFNSLSVWCIPVGIDFGSVSF